MKKTENTCKECKGSGFSDREPIKCNCPTVSCIKCQNNEGFIVHPLELCDYCYGTGNIKQAKQVLNIIKPRKNQEK